MPQAYHYPKRTHQSTAFASSTLQTLKPSLVYAGLLAGAVGGAPESIQAPALDDHHTPVDNKAGGAVASIKSWLTLPKARRLSDVQRHQGLVSTRYINSICSQPDQQNVSDILKRA